MAAMWSHVKFETCGSVSNVPTSYFKDVFEKTLNPEELQVGSVYSVFWSPAGETVSPQDFTSKGNEIIDVDNLPVKEKNRLVKENKNKPLAGYYDAVLVDLRSAEDSFETVSSEKTSSSKRTAIPTRKVLANQQQQKAKKETTTKISETRLRSKAQKLATEEASQGNILSFLSSTSAGQALDLPKAKSSDFSANVTKTKPSASEALPVGRASEKDKKVAADEAYRAQLLARLGSRGLGNKVSQLQTRNDSGSTVLEEDIQQTKEIEEYSAEYWKKKFEEAKKQSEKQAKTLENSKKEDKKHKHPKTVIKGPQPALGKLKRTSNETSDSEKRKFSSGGKGASKASHDGKADNKLSDKESSDSLTEDDDDMDKDTTKESAEDSDDESEMAISYIKKKKIKPGEDGDSLFVFNEAAKLWKPKVLAIRSPTGLSASRLKAAPYPKLTPDKKKTIEGALKRRIKGESPPVSKQDRVRRVSRLNYLLSQKIGSVRRSLRDKGVAIPSAERVNQATEEDPGADGTAAYEEEGPAEP